MWIAQMHQLKDKDCFKKYQHLKKLPGICCLQEVHFRYEHTDRLKE